jgi:hypothetical protein
MTQRLCDHDRRRAVSQQSCGVRMPELVKRYRLYLSFHERSLKRSLIGAGLPRRAAFLPEQGLGAVSIGGNSFEQLDTRFAQPMPKVNLVSRRHNDARVIGRIVVANDNHAAEGVAALPFGPEASCQNRLPFGWRPVRRSGGTRGEQIPRIFPVSARRVAESFRFEPSRSVSATGAKCP